MENFSIKINSRINAALESLPRLGKQDLFSRMFKLKRIAAHDFHVKIPKLVYMDKSIYLINKFHTNNRLLIDKLASFERDLHAKIPKPVCIDNISHSVNKIFAHARNIF